MKYKTVLLTILLVFGTILVPSYAFASEGTVELRSTDGNDYRCYASSLLMQNWQYRVTVSCRDLLYSPDDQIAYYHIWVVLENGKSQRLGDLALGRISFDVGQRFTELYVTREYSKNPKTSSGQVVMRGSIAPIPFLENKQVAAVVPSPVTQNNQLLTLTPTASQSASTREKITVALQRAAIIAVGVVLVGGAIIFAVTRAKG